MDHQELKNKWKDLFGRLGAQGKADVHFEELAKRYSEPHRKHHGISHISRCLEDLDIFKNHIFDVDSVEAAIWFHDAVYNPRREDNEDLSADLARKMLREMLLHELDIMKIINLIMATKHSLVSEGRQGDFRFVVDIDFADFGKPAEQFWEFETGIRQEYQWAEDVIYARGRMGFLRALLERDCVFLTVPFRERYEAKARGNIDRLMNHLAEITKK